MKKGRNASFIQTPDETFLGINLGSDWVSEHEWGIEKLREYFKMKDLKDDSAVGLERRKVQQTVDPELAFHIVDDDRGVGFWFHKYCDRRHPEHKNYCDQVKPGELFISSGEVLGTAWSESDFGMIANNEESVRKINKIKDAFQTANIVLGFYAGEFLANAGLAIMLADKLPKDLVSKWETADKEKIRLRKDVEATGIENQLRKAGKEWIALTPRRDEKHGLLFWLNPQNQDKYNYGWFTIDDLRFWMNDKGRVLKSNDKERK